MATTEERLLARIEANASKLVSEMKKASDVTRQRMKEIDDAVVRNNRSAVEKLGQAGAAYRKAATDNRAFTAQIQSSAYQVGDFAVQVAAGTSPMRAMAQQLPQLVGGFGMWGAVAGAAAAIAIPLAVNWLGAGRNAVTLEKAVSDLSSAVETYIRAADDAGAPTDELRKKYGALTEEARIALKATEDIARIDTLDKVKVAVDKVLSSLTDFSLQQSVLANGDIQESVVRVLLDDFGLAEQATQRLLAALNSLAAADGLQAQVTAAAEVQAVLDALYPSLEAMPEPLQKTYKEMAAVIESGAQLKAKIDEVNGSLDHLVERANDVLVAIGAIDAATLDSIISKFSALSGWVSAVAQDALVAARALDTAAKNRQAAAGAMRVVPLAGPAGAPAFRGSDLAPQSSPQPKAAPQNVDFGVPGSRGGGRGGGGVDPNDFIRQRVEAALAAVDAAKAEAEAMLMGAEAAATAKAKYDLLAQARAKNLDLDRTLAATGRTLRQEIDLQAEAIGKATVEADRYSDRVEFMTGEMKDLKSSFLDAAFQGESLSVVLREMALDFARAAAEAALFGTGPFAGSGFSLFGGIMPSFAGGGDTGSGPRMGGLDGRGGFGAMLHPGETVIDRRLGGAGGGEVGVRLYVDRSGNWQAAVAQISGAVSARVVSGAMQQQQRTFGQTLAAQQARGVAR